MIVSILILALVTAQRLGELVVARRNTARLMATGGVEHGAAHYPLIVVPHAAWLAGLWWLAWDRPASLPWLLIYRVLQALRVWVLVTLGARWTTRIITVPGKRWCGAVLTTSFRIPTTPWSSARSPCCRWSSACGLKRWCSRC